MASYTQHYQLHQWEPDDHFLRTDFNGDLEKIDTALGEIAATAEGRASIVTGTYTGDGTAQKNVELGFSPSALYVCTQGGLAGTASGSYYTYGGLALRDSPVKLDGASESAIAITASGFTVSDSAYRRVNTKNWVYHYAAMR